MNKLKPLKLATANIMLSPIAPIPMNMLLAGQVGEIPPDIVAFQDVVATGLAGTDVSISNPKAATDAAGFPGGWTTVFVCTANDGVNGVGHAICIRNASGLTVASMKSTTFTNLPPTDKKVRKLLTVVLKTREGVLFTVQSTQLSWAGTANSTATKGNIELILATPGPQIVMGDLKTAWKYVKDICEKYGYSLVPISPAVTSYGTQGTYCFDYILTNFGELTNSRISEYHMGGNSDHLVVCAELIDVNLMTDKSGILPHTVTGIKNRTYEDTPVA
jgi:endonuclease/exonuclease/phosphatase family metal-dependent hydrolase